MKTIDTLINHTSTCLAKNKTIKKVFFSVHMNKKAKRNICTSVQRVNCVNKTFLKSSAIEMKPISARSPPPLALALAACLFYGQSVCVCAFSVGLCAKNVSQRNCIHKNCLFIDKREIYFACLLHTSFFRCCCSLFCCCCCAPQFTQPRSFSAANEKKRLRYIPKWLFYLLTTIAAVLEFLEQISIYR